MTVSQAKTLRQNLNYHPQELQFGTSGRRGLVEDLTQLEVFINAVAELEFLQSLPKAEGGITKGDDFFYARDLRPSSSSFVAEHKGRGELAQAIEQAIRYSGMTPVNLGQIPTPALTCFALARGKGSIMVTGSHIPFDRNGYKTNTSQGELLKIHEQPINEKVKEVRERFYEQEFSDSLFNEEGLLKSGSGVLSIEHNSASTAYLERYVDFFQTDALKGMKVLIYQHSAVGRDLLVEIVRSLGAEAVVTGRSNTFIPIDTENMDDEQLSIIQNLYDTASAQHGNFDAVISTDGDSDRPLILGVYAGKVRFFGGDLVGMLTAELLGADAVVVPISANDGIDRSTLQSILEPKTRIGSPFVIAGMQKALAKGKKVVCGWEANGGFLTGSNINWRGRTLTALPTRDAVLPILAVLFIANRDGSPLTDIFARLPNRYSRAALIKHIPRTLGMAMIKHFSPVTETIHTVIFKDESVTLLDENDQQLAADYAQQKALVAIRQELSRFFSTELEFGAIERINYVDGIRIYFNNDDVAHLRPSGNADELRIYAVADSQVRADTIAELAVGEPGGVLHCLVLEAKGIEMVGESVS